MTDRLENFVRDHNNDFDILESKDVLWKGIEKQIKRNKKHRISFYLYKVAAVAAILIITFSVQKYFFGNKGEIIIPELQEAEMYYSGLMSTKLQQVKPMLSAYPGLEDELEYDLTELDNVYKNLKEDLKDNIANQEVLEAMIDNYRYRIDILEEMVLYLEKDNNNNNKKSEYEL